MFPVLARLLGRLLKPAPRAAPPPKRTILQLEELEPRDCPSVVSLTGSGNWNNPAIWSTNAVPTQNDDVDLTGAFNVQFQGSVNGPTAANTVTLDAAFTGDLQLYSGFQVASGLELDNGVIDQFGGVGASDISVNGFFNWSGGVLNSTGVKAALDLLNGTAKLTGTNLTTGDDLNISNFKVSLQTTGNLTFINNAGMTLANNGVFSLDSPTANIATNPGSTGKIVNGGGLFALGAANASITCALPYVSTDAKAALLISSGSLAFTRADAINGVSVYQIDGYIGIGGNPLGGVTLEVDKGLTMTGGQLVIDPSKAASKITVGDVAIHGGTVQIGRKGIAELDCDGNVTMDGGTYQPSVDLTTTMYSVWSAKSFALGGTSTLTPNSLNIPAILPAHKAFGVLLTNANNSITGDFATKNLAIPGTGKSYTAGPDGNHRIYDVITP